MMYFIALLNVNIAKINVNNVLCFNFVQNVRMFDCENAFYCKFNVLFYR